MSQESILSELKASIREYDWERAERLAKESVKLGIDPVKALEAASEALREIGDMFGRGELFLTHLMAAARAMEATAKVLTEEIRRRRATRKTAGKVLIGTVEGDIHSIGKNIVAAMLSAAGFDVVDLGENIPAKTFVEKVRELCPDILGLSALMTTTMVKQREVVEAIKSAGLREKIKIIVGGVPVTNEWAKEIGADACGYDAQDAVNKALKLLGVQSPV